MKKMPSTKTSSVLKFVLLGAVVWSFIFWFSTLWQPLIDRDDFRQAQTALTALFLKPGLHGLFFYETPVVGYPWSIPFEFPLFQAIAMAVSRWLPLELTASGRLLSVLFGYLCLLPATYLLEKYNFGRKTSWLFVLLYLTSPIYLYWNRAFLMESMALFFSISSIALFVLFRELDQNNNFLMYFVAFGLVTSLALSLLIKVTTALPAFLFISLIASFDMLSSLRNNKDIGRKLILIVLLVVAFLPLILWTNHADELKSFNPFGQGLTSVALRSWNFGVFADRLRSSLWLEVIVNRSLGGGISAVPLLILLVLGVNSAKGPHKILILSCAFLWILPLLVFTPLHVSHEYYQSANQIYLLIAVAASASRVFVDCKKLAFAKYYSVISIALFIIASQAFFFTHYLPSSLITSTAKLEASRVILNNTSADSGLIVFGNSWSSSIPYLSQRRSIAKDAFDKDVLVNPSYYLHNLRVGSIVSRTPLDHEIVALACPSFYHSFFEDKSSYPFFIDKHLKSLSRKFSGRVNAKVDYLSSKNYNLSPSGWNVYICR